MVRIVIISDTHGSHDTIDIPNGDILIHCGDSEMSLRQIDEWVGRQPHAQKILVAGNMDRRLLGKGKDVRNAIYLEDELIDTMGLRVYGSPWTPRFYGVFQLRDEAEATEVWTKIPQNIDILVTHGPPRNMLDTTSRGQTVGDCVLAQVVNNIKPRVHCFGHIHESYGISREGDTLFCNAALPKGRGAIVLDLEPNSTEPAKVVSG